MAGSAYIEGLEERQPLVLQELVAILPPEASHVGEVGSSHQDISGWEDKRREESYKKLKE